MAQKQIDTGDAGRLRAPEGANSTVSEVIDRCRTLYDRSSASNRFVRERIRELCKAGATIPDVKIRVEERDQLINYSYTGELPRLEGRLKSGELVGSYVYETTNEFYSNALQDRLKELQGINSYIGVIGGGDQHIVLLGALQRSNKLSNVMLCDINPAQIFMGIMAFASYNTAVRLGEIEKFAVGNRWGRMRAPVLGTPISISLEHRNMLQSISEAKPDTYFIYLSNMLTLPFYLRAMPRHSCDSMWLSLAESRGLLLSMIKNQNIRDGSCVMAGTILSGDPAEPRVGNAVLMKRDGRFKVCAHDGSFDANRLKTYLAAMGDDEKFASWLVGKGFEAHKGESEAEFSRMVKRVTLLRR